MKQAVGYILKGIKIVVITLSFFLVTYLVFALLFSIISTSPQDQRCVADKTIFVSSNGIHLDVIVPKSYLPEEWFQNLNLINRSGFIAFGWGDKGFYLQTPTWDDFKTTVSLKALFLPSESVMHVTNYSIRYTHWHRVPICKSQLNALLEYIHQSFKKDTKGRYIEIKDVGYSISDTFFEANGSYSCITTCNNWVNRGLKKVDIRTALWSPFDKGVLYHVKNFSVRNDASTKE